MWANSFFTPKMKHFFSLKPTGFSFLFCCLLLGSWSCTLREQKLSEGRTKFEFLQAEDAVSFISTDPTEGYFQQVNKLDIGLQLDSCLMDTTSTVKAVTLLQQSQIEDLSPFTEREENIIRSQLGIIRQWCMDKNPSLLPDTLFLVKVGGRHYGAGTFYTRGKAIVVPGPAIQNADPIYLRQTLLHEIFHIYSRFHPEKKEALYDLIGFQKLPAPVVWPDRVLNQRLLNPDGLDDRFSIQLEELGTKALPVLVSTDSCISNDGRGFLNYIRLGLVPIENHEGAPPTISMQDTVLDYLNYPSFLEQVSVNTSYILHPDEVLADNFALLMFSLYEADKLAGVSLTPEGSSLLKRMDQILSSP